MTAQADEVLAFIRTFPDHTRNSQSKWSDDDFKELLRVTGGEMPKELEIVLRNVGSPGFDDFDHCFEARFLDGSTEVGEIQILCEDVESAIYFHRDFVLGDQRPPRLPNGYVVFGTADGGNGFLLSEAKRDASPIYLWPLASDAWGEGDNARGLGKVADSFLEFLRSLRTADEFG